MFAVTIDDNIGEKMMLLKQLENLLLGDTYIRIFHTTLYLCVFPSVLLTRESNSLVQKGA
jgi:hypothetical protein